MTATLTDSAKQVSRRWTPALMKAAGFTPVSIFFLENYSALPKPLSHAEALLVIQLMRHKFDREAPYPGFTTLARRMGVTPTAVRGYARSLENKGYLKREMRTSLTNKFHLEPLFEALEKLLKQSKPKPPSDSGTPP
jgi:DNA-binding MarR family transcriptional regulator